VNELAYASITRANAALVCWCKGTPAETSEQEPTTALSRALSRTQEIDMLTRNYVAIAEQTQRPFTQSKSTRAHRHWSWNPKQRKPSKVTLINPKDYDRSNTQC
jgi:hypothetical protein